MSSIDKPSGIGLQAIYLHKHLSKYCNCRISDYRAFKIIPRGIRKFSLDTYINLQRFYSNYDVVHYQNNSAPLFKGRGKRVVTIHDLGVFLYPDTVPFIYVKYNQHSIRKAFERADGIITPSQSIKNEIVNLFSSANPDIIFPCVDGVRDIFWENVTKSATIETRHSLKPNKFFFFLGSLSRRKNLKFLLEAFIKAKRKGLLSKETILVLGGQQWWGSRDFQHLLNKDFGITTLGYLTDEDIVWLYRNCIGFIFPSIYEGFGMPIIEAMSQGVPIIVSKIPTSIELDKNHNEQMLKFDLNNEEELIENIVYLEKNHNAVKEKLNYGSLSKYHFDNVAKQYLEVYEKVLSN
ncbi:MAG: glycosyltransferase family 1 protein [Parachlamydiaceae bacterium]|nr:glycosyltransferase family 1 protein [Parachlamydiaceae bacterium]